MPSIIEISAELSRIWPELNLEGPINREERIRAIISHGLNAQTRCSFCGRLFNTDTAEGKQVLKNHICECEKSPLVQTIISAEGLVRHMWIHSAYKQNGYLQMSTMQKKMYCAAIGAAFDPLEPKFPDENTCQCRTCIQQRSDVVGGLPAEVTRMIVCEHCGNKRCPHANDHRNECTNSNEPGQPGSAY